jgi:hypothetical protein
MNLPMPFPPSSLLLQMQRELPSLSPKLGHVARYCIDHAATLHHHRIQDVARACGTIPASVVRLAQRFGLRGYQELKYALVERAEREALDPVVTLNDWLHPDSARALEDLEATTLALGSLKGLVARPEFRLAVQALRGARRIHVVAAGPTDEAIAQQLRSGLRAAGLDASSQALAHATNTPGPDDWLVQVAVWDELPPAPRHPDAASAEPQVLRLLRGRMNRDAGRCADSLVLRLGTDPRRLLHALALCEALVRALDPDVRRYD